MFRRQHFGILSTALASIMAMQALKDAGSQGPEDLTLLTPGRMKSRTAGSEGVAGDKLAKRFAKAAIRGPRGY
jgi:hypothetical protein